MVVASPPYNQGVDYNVYDDDRPFDEYFGWLARVFAEIKRVLRHDGSFFLNAGSSRSKPWNAMQIAETAGKFFTLQNEIIWVKSITLDGHTHGHFTPISGDRYLNHNYESIFHFTKTGTVPLDRLAIGVPYEDESNLMRNTATQNLRCAGNVWYIPYPTKCASALHPATYPTELAERCIRLVGLKRNTVVLDPFAGSGSTLLAAQTLGVAGIGIEIDPAYCRHAQKRLGILNVEGD